MEEENTTDQKKPKEKTINLEKFNNTREEEVGITEFMCPDNPGFKCVLKHRYSDFIVNEIGVDGKVVWIKEIVTLKYLINKIQHFVKPPTGYTKWDITCAHFQLMIKQNETVDNKKE